MWYSRTNPAVDFLVMVKTQPLVLARNRLADAVAALADPQPVCDGGVGRWLPPVYSRLRAEMVPRPVAGRRIVPGSRPPCRSDVLAWVCEVDATVAGWQDGAGTVDRLHRLRARAWAPEACAEVAAMAVVVQRWAVGAAELLGDAPPVVALRLPCPSCGTRFTYRQSAGERVRSWALQVSEAGCRCSACDACWEPERFEFLAKLLGLPALPAA